MYRSEKITNHTIIIAGEKSAERVGRRAVAGNALGKHTHTRMCKHTHTHTLVHLQTHTHTHTQKLRHFERGT